MRAMNRIISTTLLLTPLLLSPLLPVRAGAAETDSMLKDDPPTRYVVEKGDTLWDISSRFLKSPWRWPDIWGINKEDIKNPHLIYPGDVIILDLSGATPRLRLEGMADGGQSRWAGAEKLSPQIRSQDLSAAPIPTLPARLIEPFLGKPLIVDPDAVRRAPRIASTPDERVVVTAGDTVYAEGIKKNEGRRWTVYRQGRRFQDPDTRELLGYEAIYLGNFEVTSFGEISVGTITKSLQEITTDDRLAVSIPSSAIPFVPHSPSRPIRGKVVAGSDNSVGEIPPLTTVVINRGGRDGMEVGHVLGLFRSEGMVTASNGGKVLRLPEERYGVAMIYRVFPRMSYALVLNSSRPVHLNDVVQNP